MEIYNLMPQAHYPVTVFIAAGTDINNVKHLMLQKGITYPLIAKPDMGLRGNAVKKITDASQLENYNRRANFDYLIQQFVTYKNEVGIFYVRFPGEQQGRITGIVMKELLTVTGDGISALKALIKKDPRYEMQLKVLKKELGDKLDIIPAQGEKVNLVPLGNHCRGAKFIDGSHLISPALESVIDNVARQIPGFYFGRMDIMYNTWQELEEGHNFSIIEINGAASEPTHIYDPSHNIFYAWKELARHITYMFRISVINNSRGVPYLTFSNGMKQYKLHRKLIHKYESL